MLRFILIGLAAAAVAGCEMTDRTNDRQTSSDQSDWKQSDRAAPPVRQRDMDGPFTSDNTARQAQDLRSSREVPSADMSVRADSSQAPPRADIGVDSSGRAVRSATPGNPDNATNMKPAGDSAWRSDNTVTSRDDDVSGRAKVEKEEKTEAQPAAARVDEEDSAITSKEFVEQAASSGIFETMSADLAIQKNPDNQMIRQFAEHLKADHTKANEELIALAARKSIQIPKQMLPQHKEIYDRLVKLSGAEFDRQFLQAQNQAHAEAVQLFENAAKNLDDAELKQFAQKNVPVLQGHLKMAKDHAGHLGTQQ